MFDPQPQSQGTTQPQRQVSLDEFDEMVRQKYQIPKGFWESTRSTESGGDDSAVSPTGVRGSFQVTRRTAEQYGLNRDDPYQQRVAAARYMRDLYEEERGKHGDPLKEWAAVRAKYYAGPNAVDTGGNISGKSRDNLSNPQSDMRKFAQTWGQWRKQNGDDLAEFGDVYRPQPKTSAPTTPATRPGPLRQPAQTGVSPYDKLKHAPANQPGGQRPAFENPFDYQTAGQTLRRDLQRRDELVPTTPELRTRQQAGAVATQPSGLREAAHQFLQSAGKGLARIPQGFAELADTLGRYTPVEGETYTEHQARTAHPTNLLTKEISPYTRAAEQRIQEAVPVDPNDKSWLTAKIPAALGSTVPFVVGGAATRGSKLAAALLGAASNAADIGAEFDAAGGDPSKRDQAILAAAGVGLTEVAGIGRLMAKFGANRGMLEMAKQVLEEGGQEGLQQWLNNLIASDVGGYDPNRPASQGVAESTALGGIVGGAFGGASSAANKVLELRSQVQAEDAIRREPPTTPLIRETQVAGQPRRATEIVPLAQLQQAAPRADALGNRVTEPANLRLAELGRALAEAEAANDEATRNRALARASQLSAELFGAAPPNSDSQSTTADDPEALLNAVAAQTGAPASASEAHTPVSVEEQNARARAAYEQALRRGQLTPPVLPPRRPARPLVTQTDARFAGVEPGASSGVEQPAYEALELTEPIVAARRNARPTATLAPAITQEVIAPESSVNTPVTAQPSLAQRAAMASRQAIQQYGEAAQRARSEGRHSDAMSALTAQIKALKDLQFSVDRKSPGGRKLRATLEEQAQQVAELRKQVRREQVQAERANRHAIKQTKREGSNPLLGAVENQQGGIPTASPLPEPGFTQLLANAPAPVTDRKALREDNQNLESFVISQGGVRRSQNNRGDVFYGLGREGGRPGFVNDNGVPVDVMREYANEAGYGPYETEAEFLDALRDARNIFSERRRVSSALAEDEEAYYRHLAEQEEAGETGPVSSGADRSPNSLTPSTSDLPSSPLAITTKKEAATGSQFALLLADQREQINRLYSQPLNSPEAQTILQDLQAYAQRTGIEPRHLGALLDDVRNYQSDRAKSQNLRERQPQPPVPLWRRTREGNSEPLDRTGQTDALRPATGSLAGENPRPDESVRRTTDPEQLRTAELTEPPSGLLDFNDPDELPPVPATPETRRAAVERLTPAELEQRLEELTALRNQDIRAGGLNVEERRNLREELGAANERRKALVKLKLLPPRTSVEKPTPERIQARREANQQAGGKWQQQTEMLPRLNDETLRKRIGQAETLLEARGGPETLRNKSLVEYLQSARAEYAERQGKRVRGATGEIGGEQRPLRNRVPPTAELMKPRTVTHPNPQLDGKPVLADTADGRVVVANPENKGGVSVVKDQAVVETATPLTESGVESASHERPTATTGHRTGDGRDVDAGTVRTDQGQNEQSDRAGRGSERRPANGARTVPAAGQRGTESDAAASLATAQPLPATTGSGRRQRSAKKLANKGGLLDLAEATAEPMATAETVIQAVTGQLPPLPETTAEASAENTTDTTPETTASPKPAQPPKAKPGKKYDVKPSQQRKTLTGASFAITPDIIEQIEAGGQMTKFRQNVQAIETMRAVLREGRPATRAEQEALALYAGFGGIKSVFNPYLDYSTRGKWLDAQKELRALLGEKEYAAAEKSTLNAHYTSPRIVNALWGMAERLGFRGGRVLEPSMGSGNFLGLTPAALREKTAFTGVELDLTTGEIARLLYPDANIKVQGFEELQVPDNFYDLAIGNVPFGDYRISDPRYNKFVPSIHNYFFLKTLDKVRPGGIVLYITSTGTLDSSKAEPIRKHLYSQADLVDAFRLPADTFKNALTSVVTDVLILRKRLPGEQPGSDLWVRNEQVENPDGGPKIKLNSYFAANRAKMLGEFNGRNKLYQGRVSANVERTEDFEQRLAEAMLGLPTDILSDRAKAAQSEFREAGKTVKAGAFVVQDGKLFRNEQGGLREVEKAEPQLVQRVEGMLRIRDLLNRLTDAELGRTQEQPDQLRRELNEAYDKFVRRFGYLSEKANGEALKGDPDVPRLQALELWDAKKKRATKAPIFAKSTIVPLRTSEKPKDITEAVIESFQLRGEIVLPRVADRLGITLAEAAQELTAKGIAFQTPAGNWEIAARYLSGNVRRKLIEAQAAAEQDPFFEANVEALQAVVPPDISHKEIAVQIGAPWIEPNDISNFVAELFQDRAERIKVHYDRNTGAYQVELEGGARALVSREAVTTWGTQAVPFRDLLDAALSGRSPKVTDTIEMPDGSRKEILNAKETQAAQTKLDAIKQRFREWVWESEERRERLTKRYNEQFNSLRPAEYDASFMLDETGGGQVPGMNPNWKLRPHQMSAVLRTTIERRGLMAHEVGLGKTLAMIASASELKRLGIVRKPAIAVPKKVLPGFVSAARAAFPLMRIHVIDGRDAGKRQYTMSQVATGDHDLVLMTHDNLDMLKLRPEFEAEMLQKELDEVDAVYDAVRAENFKNRETKKSAAGRIEAQIRKRRERLAAKINDALKAERKDDTIYFEDTGIDFLFVDEFHKYKSLPVVTALGNIKGVPTGDSQRAVNMLMRARYLQGLNKGGGLVAATGTPVSNSLVESWIMAKFLQPDILEEAGVQSFDAWARNFAEVASALEFDATGRWKPVNRMSKFKNLPELQVMSRITLDVKTAKETGILEVRPKRKDKVVTVPLGKTQRLFMRALRERADAIRSGQVEPYEDNYLVVSNDGRLMAADMRLVLPGMSVKPSAKVAALAREVLRIHAEKPGTTQMIFCDIGVQANAWGFRLYDEIINQLVAGGIPKTKIIDFSKLDSDAKVEKAVERLNTADALIAIGHRENMGTGVNAQTKMAAVHQFDGTWKPALIEQSEARGWRQGNENKEIEIISYVAEGSFDAVMWSTVARKQQGIASFMRGQAKARELDEEDGETLSYEQIAATASGDQDYLRKADLEQRVFKLQLMEQAHGADKLNREREIPRIRERIKAYERQALAYDAQAEFAAQVKAREVEYVGLDGKSFTERKEAAKGLVLDYAIASKMMKATRPEDRNKIEVGRYKGLRLYVNSVGQLLFEVPAVKGAPAETYMVNVNETEFTGTLQSIERSISAIAENRAAQRIREETIPNLEQDLTNLQQIKDSPFPYAQELETAQRQLDQVTKRLAAKEVESKEAGEPLIATSGLDVRMAGELGRKLRRGLREKEIKASEIPAILERELERIKTESRVAQEAYREYKRKKTDEYLNRVGLEEAALQQMATTARQAQAAYGEEYRETHPRQPEIRYSGLPIQLDFKPAFRALQAAFAEGQRIARKEGVFDATKFAGKETLNLFRALKLSGDIPLLRQGAMVSLPLRYWARAARDLAAARQAWSDEGFRKMKAELEQLAVEVAGRPIAIAKVAHAAGVDFTSDLFVNSPTRQSVEEGYESSIARSLPVLHNLEQFNAIFMDLRRLDVFHRYLDVALRRPNLSAEQRVKAMKDAAELVNYLSGRARQKDGARITNAILGTGSLLESPQYLTSRVRLLNPRTYTRVDAAVRKEALKDVSAFALMVLAAGALAAQAGITVSLDPDDSDFLKLVLPGRKTRYDLAAGFGPLLRLFWQVGKWATNAEEDKEKLAKDTREEAVRFARGKLSSVPSYVATALNDWTEINGEKTSPGKAALDRVVPLMAQDFRKAYEEEGTKGLVQTLPALIGAGVQQFERPRNQARAEISKQAGETMALPHWRTPSPYDRTWNLKPQPGEGKPEFERRRTHYEPLARDAANRLEAFPGYQQADAGLKERALRLLRERLSDAGKDERSNLGKLNPGAIMTSVRELEVERRRKAAKERGWIRPQPNP